MRWLIISANIMMITAMNAQPATSLRLGLAGGMAYNNSFHRFSGSVKEFPVQPGFFLAGNLSFARLNFIEPSQFDLRMEIFHAQESTGKVDFLRGDIGELAFSRTFLLLWSRLSVPGQFTPFIEIGIGFGQLTIDQEAWENTHSLTRGLVFGPGGGVLFEISQAITVQAYGQAIYLLRKVKVDPTRTSSDVYSPPIFVLGLGLHYSL